MAFRDSSGSTARPRPVALLARDDAPPVTLALATQMLPLIRRIVNDLHVEWEAWRAAVTRYDTVVATLDADVHAPLARAAQRDVARHAEEIESLRAELVSLGAVCRSPRTGRIEWATIIAGAPARLLWQPGESAVTRWEDALRAAHDDAEPDEADPSRS